jgi:hypothetical protein
MGSGGRGRGSYEGHRARRPRHPVPDLAAIGVTGYARFGRALYATSGQRQRGTRRRRPRRPGGVGTPTLAIIPVALIISRITSGQAQD